MSTRPRKVSDDDGDTAAPGSWGWLRGLRAMRAGGRLFIALVLGLMAGSWAAASQRFVVTMLLGWCVFALASLVLSMLSIGGVLGPTRRGAVRNDQSSSAILGVVLLGCAASITAIVVMLMGLHDAGPGTRIEQGLLALASVVLSWLLIHVRFAFHYAHRYIELEDESGEAPLLFPGQGQPTGQPTYGDFLYFSFVIGMTSQVSDVGVSHAALRRLVLLHGLLSFAFNLLVLALAVNAIAAAF
jgi:uncharacterized membrane protein